MKKSLRSSLLAFTAALAVGLSAGLAQAAGELNLYNWGNYTSPEMLAKFEKETGIKVNVTDYDSNDTALAKIRAGGHGFDLVVPSANYVQIFASEGLIVEPGIPDMPNFKNIAPQWVDVAWDPGRKLTVPWQWGLTGIVVDTSLFKGDINTSAIFLDPPAELAGKINVAPEMNDVLFATIRYMGGEWCSGDLEMLKKVRDKLVEAKPKWIAMDYGTIEKFASRDYGAAYYWNGAAMRSREANPDVRFGFPKEGFPFFMDSVALLKDAKNVENAKTFLNFIMAPENAAMISEFAKYANGIAGSEAFMSEAMKTAPELTVPPELQSAGVFLQACPPEINELYTKIWTDVNK
jgi:spermidine/putrescine transport system substrate-binding protein